MERVDISTNVFLDVFYEIEQFTEQQLYRSYSSDYKEKMLQTMRLIKHIFIEIFIADMKIETTNLSYTHNQIEDLIRDVLHLFSFNHFEKKEVLHLIENIHDDSVIAEFYQRI
jgi:hypothetical protein